MGPQPKQPRGPHTCRLQAHGQSHTRAPRIENGHHNVLPDYTNGWRQQTDRILRTLYAIPSLQSTNLMFRQHELWALF